MTLIVAHKDCMDGLCGAAIISDLLSSKPHEVIFAAYGDDTYNIINHSASHIIFVDFSFNREDTLLCAAKFDSVTILDHHKTAEANLSGITDEASNIELIFDMNKSGAMLAYDYAKPRDFPKQVVEYIQDRDLWTWKLLNSKEFNEGLRHLVKPNDIVNFNSIIYAHEDELEPIISVGTTLLQSTDKYVNSKLQNTQIINLNGQAFVVCNTTTAMSELGNALCKEHNLPSATYQISSTGQVWWSLRSLDTLPDISSVAKVYGGGGHRNAAGFEINIELLPLFLE